MSFAYTSGVCSRSIQFTIDADGIVHNVRFEGGCPGNLTGICRLVEGMPATEIIARLEGITCGRKPTSCPDQFARALRRELEQDTEQAGNEQHRHLFPILS